MANAVTLSEVIDLGATKDRKYPGVIPVYVVTATAAFDTNIAADGGEEFALAVPGAALGDFCRVAPSGADPEPNVFHYDAEVTAADVVSISVHAAAADTPAVTGFTVEVSRYVA